MKNEVVKKIISFIVIAVLSCVIFLSFSTIGRANAQTSAQCMVVIERTSRRILNGFNYEEKRPMASTTKIATAITVIESVKNLDQKVKVPSQAVGVEGSSIYLEKDEELSVRDLLYGLMLQSGNDCAVALAIIASGSVENFAKSMNETAKKAGAINTNFVNPHGLHDENHYTTALDLALISAYAMENQTFREIVSTKRYTCSWQGRDYARVILNKNKILSNFEGGNGIKTGYTKKAGRCLVASAERDGMEVISVVLNCAPMFCECATLMEQAFQQYDMIDLSSNCPVSTATVTDGKEESVELKIRDEKLYYPLRQDELKTVNYTVSGVKEMVAPVKKGEENGKIQIYLEKRLLFERKFYTIKEVAPLSVSDRLGQIIDEWAN